MAGGQLTRIEKINIENFQRWLNRISLTSLIFGYMIFLGVIYIITNVLSKIFDSVNVVDISVPYFLLIYAVAIAVTWFFVKNLKNFAYTETPMGDIFFMLALFLIVGAFLYFAPDMFPDVIQGPAMSIFSAIGLP